MQWKQLGEEIHGRAQITRFNFESKYVSDVLTVTMLLSSNCQSEEEATLTITNLRGTVVEVSDSMNICRCRSAGLGLSHALSQRGFFFFFMQFISMHRTSIIVFRSFMWSASEVRSWEGFCDANNTRNQSNEARFLFHAWDGARHLSKGYTVRDPCYPCKTWRLYFFLHGGIISVRRTEFCPDLKSAKIPTHQSIKSRKKESFSQANHLLF